ncbi:hypothetical protein [Chitinophaga rhizosphaerae]|uniref:hypothetical protein n=1 Tax=Chitinophaga rhizosphaerae TaxID=1864947 RepID=UPI000F7FCD8C|nr:hypothetical protein [Chitinophaga rhizosphaerae]
MKRIFLILAVMTAFTASTPSPASAQVNVSINLGIQPAWGPVGYDYAEYYYLPDIDIYYYIPTQTYIYFDFGRWVHTRYLPARYGYYDFYRGYKVVINQRDPWRFHKRYRREYSHYRNNYTQIVWRDRPGDRREWNNRWNNRPEERREWNSRPVQRRVDNDNRREWTRDNERNNDRDNNRREWNQNNNNNRPAERREWNQNNNRPERRVTPNRPAEQRREVTPNRPAERQWNNNNGNRGNDRRTEPGSRGSENSRGRERG